MKSFSLILLLMVLLSACGGGGSSSSGGGATPVNVVYSLDPITGPDCKNTSSIRRDNRFGHESIACFWECANYKGESPVWVSIYFFRSERTGNRWQYHNDTVLKPMCG